MSEINFNKKEDFIKEIAIFNDGEAGIVGNVRAKITRKGEDDKEKAPDYKLIASDGKGEVNEGFYYFKALEDAGFKNYQAGKLINLAQGVLGDGVEFPTFSTPKEALDGVMKMVAPAFKDKPWRVAVTYGTNRRPERYLQFKAFGSFIEPMNVEESKLKIESTDNMVRKEEVPTSENEIKDHIGRQTNTTFDEPDDLPF